jgi:hypothetical protein
MRNLTAVSKPTTTRPVPILLSQVEDLAKAAIPAVTALAEPGCEYLLEDLDLAAGSPGQELTRRALLHAGWTQRPGLDAADRLRAPTDVAGRDAYVAARMAAKGTGGPVAAHQVHTWCQGTGMSAWGVHGALGRLEQAGVVRRMPAALPARTSGRPPGPRWQLVAATETAGDTEMPPTM